MRSPTETGLPVQPGTQVAVPRIVTAPVAMECRLHSCLNLGPARDIVIGTILGFHLREDALSVDGHIDQDVLDIVGRVGAASYCTTRDRFRP